MNAMLGIHAARIAKRESRMKDKLRDAPYIKELQRIEDERTPEQMAMDTIEVETFVHELMSRGYLDIYEEIRVSGDTGRILNLLKAMYRSTRMMFEMIQMTDEEWEKIQKKGDDGNV